MPEGTVATAVLDRSALFISQRLPVFRWQTTTSRRRSPISSILCRDATGTPMWTGWCYAERGAIRLAADAISKALRGYLVR